MWAVAWCVRQSRGQAVTMNNEYCFVDRCQVVEKNKENKHTNNYYISEPLDCKRIRFRGLD